MQRTLNNLRLLRNQILVKRDETPAHSPSGLVIPVQARKPSTTGTVVKTAADAACQVGDTVLFGQWCSQEFPVGDTTYLLLKEDPDVLGIITPVHQ